MLRKERSRAGRLGHERGRIMRYEKSPQLPARRLRGCNKSGDKTVINFPTKNNAPDNPLLYGIPETDRETIGRRYMSLAARYGYIELKKGLALYTIKGFTDLKEKEHIKSFFPEGVFYFVEKETPKRTIITECFDPFHVVERIERDQVETTNGYVLPISYKAANRSNGEVSNGI
jgi:hypothetical protein